MRNTLYYGDNLPVLREYIRNESVDLIYLDPPFNSSRSYNVLFKDESGHEADAQITAFEDTWHWNEHTERLYHELVTQGNEPVSRMIDAMRGLKDAFNLEPGKDYAIRGEPEDYASARQLAEDDRYQFQWWALSLIEARPLGGAGESKEGKKGADKGIDGVITFIDDSSGKAKRAVVQVKSGKVSSAQVRDLVGTVEREKAPIGIFITLEEPTAKMREEAAAAGLYHSPGWGKDYPRIQLLTVQELLDGATAKLPPASVTFKQAGKMLKEESPQFGFEFDA